jgi:hypothetical protein
VDCHVPFGTPDFDLLPSLPWGWWFDPLPQERDAGRSTESPKVPQKRKFFFLFGLKNNCVDTAEIANDPASVFKPQGSLKIA